MEIVINVFYVLFVFFVGWFWFKYKYLDLGIIIMFIIRGNGLLIMWLLLIMCYLYSSIKLCNIENVR